MPFEIGGTNDLMYEIKFGSLRAGPILLGVKREAPGLGKIPPTRRVARRDAHVFWLLSRRKTDVALGGNAVAAVVRQ